MKNFTFVLEWVVNKRKSADEYAKLFEYMNDVYTYLNPILVAEFGKGKYDTVAESILLNSSYQPVVISPYAETFDNSRIDVYKGELVSAFGESFVKYSNPLDYLIKPNCHFSYNDQINILMTQLPFSDREIKPFVDLYDSNKTLFIGTYGGIYDKNKKENVHEIKELYDKLNNFKGREVDFCIETVNDSYLSAIRVGSEKNRRTHSRFR